MRTSVLNELPNPALAVQMLTVTLPVTATYACATPVTTATDMTAGPSLFAPIVRSVKATLNAALTLPATRWFVSAYRDTSKTKTKHVSLTAHFATEQYALSTLLVYMTTQLGLVIATVTQATKARAF